MGNHPDTHRKTIGYALWFFGFTGAHRFYYGKPITGTIWFFTLGLFFIGWIIDLFLIPFMDEKADLKFKPGKIDYNVAWILLTFFGPFGVHRFYMGKWFTGSIYLLCTTLSLIGGVVFIGFILTGGFLLVALVAIGYIYDFWTLNQQISEINT